MFSEGGGYAGGGARSASMSYVDLYFHESFQKVSGDGEPDYLFINIR